MTTSRIWSRVTYGPLGYNRGDDVYHPLMASDPDPSLGPNPVLLRTIVQMQINYRVDPSLGYADTWLLSSEVSFGVKWTEGDFDPGLVRSDDGEGVLGYQYLGASVYTLPGAVGGYEIQWNQLATFDVQTKRRAVGGEGASVWLYTKAYSVLPGFGIPTDPNNEWMVARMACLWGN